MMCLWQTALPLVYHHKTGISIIKPSSLDENRGQIWISVDLQKLLDSDEVQGLP